MPAAGEIRRLFVYNGGFLAPRLRRILQLAGWRLTTGLPGPDDWVGVWGQSPTAWRGLSIAQRCGAKVLRFEDAFLRSLHPGRAGDAPLGLLPDPLGGVHFDPAAPSALETLLQTAPLDAPDLLTRAEALIERLKHHHLSKYAATDPAAALPDPGFVLVVDQTRGDASVRASLNGRDADRVFADMLARARADHPDTPVVVKTHPETAQGLRAGHYGPQDCDARTTLLTTNVSPWALLDRATAVYTLSSGLGFEAILAGHRPEVFGAPIYAGWGLSTDHGPVPPRRTRALTPAQLAAGALIEAPLWYDPCRERLCEVEDVVDHLAAAAHAWRQDRRGYVASGMRLWKRPALQGFFGAPKRLIFRDAPAKAQAEAKQRDRDLLVWAGKWTPAHGPALRVEDGMLRSRGLGAALTPPLSLVRDARGIYYDPTQPSDLEALIAAAPDLPPAELARADRLVTRITALGLSKYNLGGVRLDLPEGQRILVPGQVEDDASIRLGTTTVASNRALLEAARATFPNAVLIYKPHPDVEEGLRPGAVPDAEQLADVVAREADPVALIDACDGLATMTSTMGFEALLRDRPVTCFGAPFYAGWGLTQDLGAVPARRTTLVTRTQLAHAVLIGYPRYRDPVSGQLCPPEVALDRLASGATHTGGPALRLLAKAQGAAASYAHLWRR